MSSRRKLAKEAIAAAKSTGLSPVGEARSSAPAFGSLAMATSRGCRSDQGDSKMTESKLKNKRMRNKTNGAAGEKQQEEMAITIETWRSHAQAHTDTGMHKHDCLVNRSEPNSERVRQTKEAVSR